ncbi:MAG: hypothetical protein IGR80_09255 [Synechococcales cyanobacterium K44_A2020_017]|jgi:hypothetical protein|uniref:hypothetical protein n=1 Tax=Leptolyngbya sp. CCY15150 TaxID=2767772 RepID=UPI001950BB8E|nr:hypothetical protein [Leptolyngbya sp. CCY15150]MBF2090603.1 hypothetical protein [Synechococcales cyanobacterium K32_A2020_035]MBF2094931.1 hypothetical protein [Synechococcales cyanobacterium K44_A2020_017]
MARYTSLFTLETPAERFSVMLAEVLMICNFDIIYDTGDYLMAREVPGSVVFGKLVTVEALIDRNVTTATEVRLKLVIKNEELPLHTQNHCRDMFDHVNQAIADHRQWKLVEYASTPA